MVEKNNKTNFKVYGPYLIPYENFKYGRHISRKYVEKEGFWEENELEEDVGCYIFSMKTKNFTPYYVGKTADWFKGECFSNDKVHKYNGVLTKRKGKPYMFFLVPEYKTNLPKNKIKDLESFLIHQAYTVNSELINSYGKNEFEWTIGGVMRGGKGSSSHSSSKFKKMIKL